MNAGIYTNEACPLIDYTHSPIVPQMALQVHMRTCTWNSQDPQE